MKGGISEKWLKTWDRKLLLDHKKIYLIIDNCMAHPKDFYVSSIEVVFLAPNVTSIVQPFDQGGIRALKSYYRKAAIRGVMRSIYATPDTCENHISK